MKKITYYLESKDRNGLLFISKDSELVYRNTYSIVYARKFINKKEADQFIKSNGLRPLYKVIAIEQ